jgi:hypothetical protein
MHNKRKWEVKKMKDNIERRANERCSHQASVTCAYFNSDKFYHVEASNHSKDGINFFSDFPLKPGASIYVRIDSYLSEGHLIGTGGCRGVRKIGVAEVKWCNEIPGAYGAFYSTGLKYYEPAV